ncbi:MAG: hypothetical protein ACREIV_12035, partial [Planctomycetaceae bacterium]
HWAVRVAAIEALGRIGEPARSAVPYLQALSQTTVSGSWMDQRLSEAARQALERLRNGS